MSRKLENQRFIYSNFDKTVYPFKNGNYQNHCPYCLHSLNLDIKLGDQANPCQGLMMPIGVKYHTKKGY